MTDKSIGSGFLDLELRAEVWLATEDVPLGRLLELDRGKTLALSRDPDAPVDLVVNGAVVASGELVVVDGHFGFRVTQTAQQILAGVTANGGAKAAPADAALENATAPDTGTDSVADAESGTEAGQEAPEESTS